MPFSFCSARHSRISFGSSCVSARSSSTSTAVEATFVLPVRLAVGSCSFSNRMTDSCFGELMLNSSPASSKIRRAARRQLGVDALRLARERRQVDPNAVALDVGQHGHERQLQVAEERFETARREPRLRASRASCHARSARSPAKFRMRGGRQMRQGDRLLARAADVFLRQRLVAEMLERDFLDGVARSRWRRAHSWPASCRSRGPSSVDAFVREHHQIEFQIVADLPDRRVLEAAASARRGRPCR